MNQKSNQKSRQQRKKYTRQKGTKPIGSSESKFSQDSAISSKYNDVSWYAKNDQILRDAASFSYNQPLGSRIPGGLLAQMDVSTDQEETVISQTPVATAYSVPGVMTFYTALGPGISTNYGSPLNLAAQNIYSYVRYMNSGAKNYDAPDLMLYLLALDSAYACWNFYKRAYGLVCSYSQSNWYLPKYLVEAQGIDFDNIRGNLADFRQYLNVTAAKLSSFCTPAVMPIFVRHSWMFSNVWADESTPKAQMYQFAPLLFHVYDEISSPNGGYLKPVPFVTFTKNQDRPTHMNPSLKTLSELIVYLDAMIDALTKSEDIGVMSGDILKAYGQERLFKLTPVSEDYSVLPAYNEEVLGQIHNMTIPNNTYHADDIVQFTIKQDVNTGNLLYSPRFNIDRTSVNTVLLNSHHTSVTPAETMVNSRLITTWSSSASTNTRVVTACGTEIVYMAGMTFADNSGNQTKAALIYGFKTVPVFDTYQTKYETAVPSGDLTYPTLLDLNEQSEHGIIEYLELTTLISNFDWAPILRPKFKVNRGQIRIKDVGANEYKLMYDNTLDQNIRYYYAGTIGDLANWTIIERDQVENLHLTAVMSEFNIPQIGSF